MTTVNKMKFALVGLIPLLGFALLPPEVFSHFNAAGVADDSLPRAAAILVFSALSALLTFAPAFVGRLLPQSIDGRIGLFLKCYGLCFGIWMLLMWILVTIANTLGDGRISIIGAWSIGMVLLLPLGVFLIPAGNRNKRV
ncbi:MAG: hypothetical protein ABIS50_16195 [Luteolibacter sp.]|uniref:hypothetical protein n=1 Tax=Luteolibacter sp. TaxID=1962973 RepID=UPI003265EE9F